MTPVRAVARRALPGLALLAVLFAVYAATVDSGPSYDVRSANFASWKIAEDGDPTPPISDYPELDALAVRWIWVIDNADGDEVVGRAPGVVAAAVPAYWLVSPERMTTIPGAVTAALLAATTVTLFFSLVRRHRGTRDAMGAALVLGLTTPMWSVAADGMWPHTLTTFGIIGMAWAADRDRWWLVGAFGGAALWGRLHVAIVCAVLGVVVAIGRRRPAVAIRAGVASLAALALMTVWTHWVFGSFDPTSAYETGRFVEWADRDVVSVLVNQLGLWISPYRGMLVWTPLLLVLAPALRRGWKDLPDWSRALVMGGFAYTVVQGTFSRFSGGDNFYGYRLGLEMLTCLAPALALTTERMGPVARRAFGPVLVLQFCLIMPGSLIDVLEFADPSPWRFNALVAAVGRQPVLMGLLLLTGALAATLALRLWRQAAARRPTGPSYDAGR